MWIRSVFLVCGVAAMPQNGELTLSEAGVLILNETRVKDFHETNPLVTAYGRLVEGDILRSAAEDRKAVPSGQLWDNRHYSYQILAEDSRGYIEAGIQFWRDNTCIDFTEVSADSTEPRVQFVSEQGCWSNVGCVAKHQRSRVQKLSLGSGCSGLGTVTHEIGHSLGFYHEQSRSDRDQYVAIQWDNIQSNYKFNFDKVDNTEHHGVPYDLSSVMHYGTYFFSSNEKPTIVTLDPTLQSLIGQRVQPSFRDVSLMNRMYKCDELCGSPPTCLNGGYVSADCTCHCPPNTSGADCGTVTGSYYPEPACGGKVTSEGSLTSPGWPSVYPAGSDCTWWITPPPGRRAELVFDKFDILFRVYDACNFEFLEVSMNGAGEGKRYCAKELAGEVIKSTSADGDMVVRFKAYRVHYKGSGFTAQVKFI